MKKNRRWSDDLLLWSGLIGLLILIPAVIYYKVSTYGRRWEFDRYGCPVIALGEDDEHFRDGSPLQPFDQLSVQMDRSGMTHVMFVTTFLTVIVFVVWIHYVVKLAQLDLLALKAEWEASRLKLQKENDADRGPAQRSSPYSEHFPYDE